MKDGIEQNKTPGRETRGKEAALTVMIKDAKDLTGGRTNILTRLHICKYFFGQIPVPGISKASVQFKSVRYCHITL